MTEQELFQTVFRYQLTDTYATQYEVLKKPTTKIPLEYTDYLEWMDSIQLYSCYTDADIFTPQLEPFKNKVVWHNKYDVVKQPLRGLNIFECLDPDTPDSNRSYIQMRIGKVLSVTIDVLRLESVANAVMYKQELDKIHPFTNLVCAHQLLQKPMRTIYCLDKTNTITKPIQDVKRITTLQELVANYKNTPIAFLEKNYMQVYCEHDHYQGLDPNGFLKQRVFDVERFVQHIQCEHGMQVKLESGNTYTIPITNDIKLLEDYNENIDQRK